MAELKLIAGRYQVERILGEGGMGVTFLALDQCLDRRVVVKRPKGMHGWFVKEAKAQASVNHTNAVKVHDCGIDQEGPYLVMEWIAGWDLHRLIEFAGRLSQERATDIITSIGRAVAHAHAFGVIHRDIKPQNILIGSDDIPRLADFGLAKLPSLPMTQPGVEDMGTLGYAAPEQMKDFKNVDHRADIFALGQTLLAMLSGQPFPKNREVISEVPPDFRETIARCLEPKPANRFPSVEAFLEAMPETFRRPERFRAGANMVGTAQGLQVIKSNGATPARKKDHVELVYNLGEIRLSGKGQPRTIVGFCYIPIRKAAGYVIYMHDKQKYDIKRAIKSLSEYSPFVSVDEKILESLVPFDGDKS